MSTDVFGYPCVSHYYDSGNVLCVEWLTMLPDEEFDYIITRQAGDNYSDTHTQEWVRCEGDSSINIVNIITINVDGRFSQVKIYIDETLVAQFDHNAGYFGYDGTGLNKGLSLDEVRSEILSFIERWNIGV
ncbi:hypothetical protein Xoosp13_146 [Xanthomonas phage Xoo-sp13]|nr:hypothetical protein Xoosp13_146 [Xanthomonas phage Xoo-sp13]